MSQQGRSHEVDSNYPAASEDTRSGEQNLAPSPGDDKEEDDEDYGGSD